MFDRSRRMLEILRTARRYGLGEIAGDAAPTWLLGKPRSFDEPLNVRLRLALEELGPVFVKFGQTLSTRRDLLPEGMAEELSKLQDEVPPFEGAEARRLIEAAYGHSLDKFFEYFETEPMAAASIAQVHRARLHARAGEAQGREVVVKVLRPDVHERIERDVAVLYRLAGLAARFHPEAKRLRPVEIVAEYDRIITDELDLMREGANASQLGRNWAGSDLIVHPEIHFDYSTETVLVMEHMYGVPIDDVDTLKAAGVDFKVLAERGVEIFFKQVFRDNFFHADMHPGNILVQPEVPHRPRYVGLDFGIVGSLTADDQRYLAENFLAFFNQDYRKIAELHVESGWMPADTSIEEFEGAIRTVSEPIMNKPLAEISFGLFLVRLFKIARRYRYQVQPQLVLLQKTVLNVEGLGRDLYPQLDLWATAKPVLEEWMRHRASPRVAAERMRNQLPQIMDGLPGMATKLMKRVDEGTNPAARELERALTDITHELRSARRAMRWTVVGTGMVVSGVLLVIYPPAPIWVGIVGGLAGLGCWVQASRG
ncbi:putative ubiquinone biosynthesis protein UbiB [Salinisphaera shabanensis E1L3A]|uniref:Ubiquinone biosynthesis protein UbiB n=1 Tax=Salinisphaera shabanensis E1L3A TaxID=1033802 RepID=U2EJZ7_9GAMM|nr:ubiquinone biosynthesis regulatory protein kinase UbiB [Salinisphaera shabanensis]ERJ18592.1 putative ubiquinone biosynthesis protein UbiB [Salinisphaera shabanensis E1L3A]